MKDKELTFCIPNCGHEKHDFTKPMKDKEIIYKPKYDLDKNNYQRYFDDDGHEIEIFGYYKADSHIISNPPDNRKVIEKIKKLLKGTGISKITITFLNKNL